MPVLDGIEATRASSPRARDDGDRADRFADRRAHHRRAGGRRLRLPAQGRRRRRGRATASARRPGASLRSIRAPPARSSTRRSAPDPLAGLSQREREVLGLLVEGLPNKLIARRLEISEKTVKSHLTRIFRELGVTDRTQAALWAERHGSRVSGGRDQSPIAVPTRAAGTMRSPSCAARSPLSAALGRSLRVPLAALATTTTARVAGPAARERRRSCRLRAEGRRDPGRVRGATARRARRALAEWCSCTSGVSCGGAGGARDRAPVCGCGARSPITTGAD